MRVKERAFQEASGYVLCTIALAGHPASLSISFSFDDINFFFHLREEPGNSYCAEKEVMDCLRSGGMRLRC